jgi:Xaa-Pro aminopeptidase
MHDEKEEDMDILEQCLAERCHRLQALLCAQHMDGLFLTDRRLLYWLGRKDEQPVLVTVSAVVPAEAARLAEWLEKTPAPALGFDATLSASHLLRLQESVPRVKWRSLAGELGRLLAVKDRIEIALLRHAATLTRQVFDRLSQSLTAGCTEADLLHIANGARLAGGGQAFSFDPSIASGPRTRQLWADVSLRRIARGEPVVIDLGVAFRGYQCDMTRSFIVGGASAEAPVWGAALAALDEAMAQVRAAVRPGVRCHDLHVLCERVLAGAGFGQTMWHDLGHGLGLDLHEFPTVAPGSAHILAPGMVIALEPGITLGEGGVRREDVFVVTEDGCECLTS